MTLSLLSCLNTLAHHAPQANSLHTSLEQAQTLLQEETDALESLQRILCALEQTAQQLNTIKQHIALQMEQQHQRYVQANTQPGQVIPVDGLGIFAAEVCFGTPRHTEYAVIKDRLALFCAQISSSKTILQQIRATRHYQHDVVDEANSQASDLQMAILKQHQRDEENAQHQVGQLWRT